MHIILISWEFPPRPFGLIGRDTEIIARDLTKCDCKVDVITWHDHLTGTEDRKEGFRVHRVTNPVRTQVNIVTWALTLNTEFERIAADIIYASEDEERLVHSIEWICAPAAIQLKKTLHTHYVLSLYSTESERSVQGGPLSGAIGYLEKSGALQAAKVIVNSERAQHTLQKNYGVPADRLTIMDLTTIPISKLLDQYRAGLASALPEISSDPQ